MSKKLSAEMLIKVPFYDLDPMKVVWHGNYVKYFEQVRCELLDKFNFGYVEIQKSGYIWPIVDMRIKYVNSASFGQMIRCTASITEYINCLKIAYSINCAESGERLTKGHTVQVAVNIETGGMELASPKLLLERLGVADEVD